MQSLTGFSAGSSIHTYDDTIQGAWFHEFSPTAQNELHLQWDYNSFNVIPNEPGAGGNRKSRGFANNLGTNIFLPNFTILRRLGICRQYDPDSWPPHHEVRWKRIAARQSFGVAHVLSGTICLRHVAGTASSSCPSNPNGAITGTATTGCGLGGVLSSAVIDSLQGASLGAPQVYQQGFGNPDYPAYTRPLTGLYLQDSWAIARRVSRLNYGLRYEIDSQYLPLNTDYHGLCSARLLCMGSVQGSQDGDPRRLRDFLRTG